LNLAAQINRNVLCFYALVIGLGFATSPTAAVLGPIPERFYALVIGLGFATDVPRWCR
jgi:hypothetical protein